MNYHTAHRINSITRTVLTVTSDIIIDIAVTIAALILLAIKSAQPPTDTTDVSQRHELVEETIVTPEPTEPTVTSEVIDITSEVIAIDSLNLSPLDWELEDNDTSDYASNKVLGYPAKRGRSICSKKACHST